MIGPDNNIYTIIGDVGGHKNQAQNQESEGEPDGTNGILRITQDGIPVANSPLGDRVPLNLYYLYGLRNSFGFDFDPITSNYGILKMVKTLVMKLILLNQDLIADRIRCKIYGH